ncbi:MAG: SDR family NAD(P)-dependent oxidoreductase [Acidimicrobiales bacterium]
MDDQLRFDGRVVIVTGAGGQAPSLGRSHAHLFAARGAKVLVNDSGVGPDGRGTIRANAEVVAAEIRALGGEAIADTHSVTERDTAQAVVKTAADAWGRVDALVNNASVAHLADFDAFSEPDIREQIDVHLMGTIWMCRSVWSHMRDAGYGRIVNIASNGVFGGHHVAIYGAAKGGIFSLSKHLAADGARLGIVVNVLAPGAGTRAMTLHLQDDDVTQTIMDTAPPDLVSPAVAFLAHETCPVTGRFFMAASGWVSEYFFMSTKGYRHPALSLEDLRDHFDDVVDRAGAADVPPPELSPYTPKPYRPARSS